MKMAAEADQSRFNDLQKQVEFLLSKAGEANVQEGSSKKVEEEQVEEGQDQLQVQFEDDNYEENEEEGEESEEETDVASLVRGKDSISKHAPSELAIEMWRRGRRLGKDFGPEEWKNIRVSGHVKKYTTHPGAEEFAAQKADAELPDLRYQDKIQAEQRLEFLQVFINL